MSNQPTIITDPYTGRSYDFRPLFEFTQRHDAGLELVTSIVRSSLRHSHYVAFYKEDWGEEAVLNHIYGVNNLFDAFHEIAPM